MSQRSETLRLLAKESARLGFHVGRIPLGYRPGERGGESVPDWSRLPHILEVRKRYKSGELSVADAQKFLLLKGVRSNRGRALSRSSVRVILTNPYYDGYATYKGKAFLRLN